ncbi:copper amine oxidase [Paenibacillus oenotherae]|uniref:Copper amine oxidase n=1 Tax=Paenibacillus oenotherae TaxID=1435645 RepID=A0ABS7D411_9BACL|nr:stalk domain-containing protein [Paenibacillus oenotherae]MBW7474568.1 copper amine oxidase [Paenibacillus oenotherae]
MGQIRGKAAMLLLAGLLAVGGIGEGSARAATVKSKPVTIVLDQVALPLDSEPKVAGGVTLVPFRGIAEALGVTVVWDAKGKTVQAAGPDGRGGTADVRLRIGSKKATVNGTEIALAGAPVMQQGRVLIPLAFFGRQFGANVSWDGASRTVVIVSPQREMELLGFYALSSFDQRAWIPSFNEVAFGWSRIDENGEWTTGGKEYKWPQAAGDITPEALIQGAAADSAKPFLMVYAVDGKGELSKMLSTPALRDRSIESIVNTVKDKGFQGVVLDYEGLGWKDAPETPRRLLNEYTALLDKGLPDGVKLSLAVPPPNGSYRGYDYASLARTADHLVLMAYDYTRDGSPEPNAKVDEAIRMTLKQGVPKDKLMLGISIDSETERTVTAKLGLAKRYDLRGAAFWRLGIYTDAERQAIAESVSRAGG